MRRLSTLSRRRFGQGLGATLALAAPGRSDAADGEAGVRIAGFAFEPERVEIAAGETVVWINADLVPHTATSMAGDWTTGAIERGAEGRIAFHAPGEHAYVCAFHPHMTGRVLVHPARGR